MAACLRHLMDRSQAAHEEAAVINEALRRQKSGNAAELIETHIARP